MQVTEKESIKLLYVCLGFKYFFDSFEIKEEEEEEEDDDDDGDENQSCDNIEFIKEIMSYGSIAQPMYYSGKQAKLFCKTYSFAT